MLMTYLKEHQPVWFDLLNPTSEDISFVETSTGITLPTREKLSEVETSSRVSEVAGVLFLSMPHVVNARAVDDTSAPVGFVLSKRVLVTLRFSQLRSFEAVAGNIQQKPPESGAAVFAALMGQSVDASADLLEKIGNELDALSRNIFPPKKVRRYKERSNSVLRAILHEVGNAGERLSHIRESILGLQRIVLFVISSEPKWIESATAAALKSAQTDLLSLADYEAQLYSKVQFLLDAVLGFITTKQNDIFQVLTIVSVAGIPPTLIASIYGMNFKNMPELNWSWGYPYALALIVFSTILPLLWFKWRGWF
jgi:magnesium transporter